jgi:hypothetical protein
VKSMNLAGMPLIKPDAGHLCRSRRPPLRTRSGDGTQHLRQAQQEGRPHRRRGDPKLAKDVLGNR